MTHIVEFLVIHCKWCGMNSDDTRVFSCPSCGDPTCYECVYLYEEGLSCKHTTPRQRKVLTRQDWGE